MPTIHEIQPGICWFCRGPIGPRVVDPKENFPGCDKCQQKGIGPKSWYAPYAKRKHESPTSVVYFIQDTVTKHVKIGWAACVGIRFKELQTGNPRELELLATLPGGVEKEREIHRRFKHIRYRGEWFCWCQELCDFIYMEVLP